MQDEIKTALDKLEIEGPSTGAAQRVVSQAKAMQSEGAGLLLRWRRFRSWLFQLHVRYVVMATVVIAFALVGRYGEYVRYQETQLAAAILEEVEFDIERWHEDAFLLAEEDSQALPSVEEMLQLEFDIEQWDEGIDWDV